MNKLLSALSISGVVFLFSCAIRSADQVVDRNKIPAADAGVPAGNSEIRQIAFNKVAGESGHKDLHIRGMLFTKRDNGGSVQITPCSGCVVMMKGIKDTSVVVRMTTESDGYFTFHGATGDFTVTLNNPGHNMVSIGPIDFEAGGVNSLVVVNAAGNASEHFSVTRTNRVYTWTRQ